MYSVAGGSAYHARNSRLAGLVKNEASRTTEIRNEIRKRKEKKWLCPQNSEYEKQGHKSRSLVWCKCQWDGKWGEAVALDW